MLTAHQRSNIENYIGTLFFLHQKCENDDLLFIQGIIGRSIDEILVLLDCQQDHSRALLSDSFRGMIETMSALSKMKNADLENFLDNGLDSDYSELSQKRH